MASRLDYERRIVAVTGWVRVGQIGSRFGAHMPATIVLESISRFELSCRLMQLTVVLQMRRRHPGPPPVTMCVLITTTTTMDSTCTNVFM